MARTERIFAACLEASSSDEDLNAPPRMPISCRERVIKEREREMDEIETLQQLTSIGPKVINQLCECDALLSTDYKAARAREIVEQFRRQITNLRPSSPAEKNDTTGCHSQPFDRLIYLLDRYTEYCSTIGLSAWPIHYLKVAIWIKADVISLKTRVIPLRKTVRCYITTMETVRVKTRHVFYQPHEADDKPLLKRPILKELLDVLPISRSSSDLNGSLEANNTIGGVDRSTLLKRIRAQSGDHMSKEALVMVQVARGSTGRNGGLTHGKKKPDPHMHTLSRYMAFCRLLPIPIWPIEPLRVSIWLRESVLSSASPEYNGYKVSLRTAQVYLSRLEYARLKTEALFRAPFGELATVSLHRSQLVSDLLESFNPNHNNKFRFLTQSLQGDESSDHSSILGKRKLPVNSLLTEADLYQNFSHHRRPKTSSSRSSLVTSTAEDSRPDSQASSRSASPWFTSVSSYESSPRSCAEQEYLGSHASNTRKGCLSYILCPEEGYDSSFPTSKNLSSSALATAPVTRNFPVPTQWEISPLSIPRSQICHPTCGVPSFSTFDFALSELEFK